MIKLTETLADYAATIRFEDLPNEVRAEAEMAFLNWMGCVLGGCREDAVNLATDLVRDTGAHPRSSVIGHGFQTDSASAAFLNCMSSAINAYDDAHLPTVAHPSGPAAAAVLAVAQTRAVTGSEVLNALALGIEVQCRIANMLVLPPSDFATGHYVNGFSGPIGVAAAVGRLLGLDDRRMAWAMGIAATQAAGSRASHGTMTAHFRAGQVARAGTIAGLLAEKGFDCSLDAIEGRNGLLANLASAADPSRALIGLGVRHEMLANTYKPYPCGIVIHPTIDACLDIRAGMSAGAEIEAVRLRVNPLVLNITGKRTPMTSLESHVSVFHWAACALVMGKAGLSETRPSCLSNPRIAACRELIEGVPDHAMQKGSAAVEVVLRDKSVLSAHVEHARGSQARKMTHAELDKKFNGQAKSLLDAPQVETLRKACRTVAGYSNVGQEMGLVLEKLGL